ncbi:MAG: hypothetical protein CL667_03405 [Balneola sp.]|nr:hypothetical protein [Balneola sp.]
MITVSLLRAGFEASGRAATSGIISVKIVLLGDSVSESEKRFWVKAVIIKPQKKKKSMKASLQKVINDATKVCFWYVFCALCNQKIV